MEWFGIIWILNSFKLFGGILFGKFFMLFVKLFGIYLELFGSFKVRFRKFLLVGFKLKFSGIGILLCKYFLVFMVYVID